MIASTIKTTHLFSSACISLKKLNYTQVTIVSVVTHLYILCLLGIVVAYSIVLYISYYTIHYSCRNLSSRYLSQFTVTHGSGTEKYLELQELGEALKEISYPALELEKKGNKNMVFVIQSVNNCALYKYTCIILMIFLRYTRT